MVCHLIRKGNVWVHESERYYFFLKFKKVFFFFSSEHHMVSLDDWHVRDKSKAHFCLLVLPPNDIIIIAKDSFFDSFISFLIESLGGPASHYWSNKNFIFYFFKQARYDAQPNSSFTRFFGWTIQYDNSKCSYRGSIKTIW